MATNEKAPEGTFSSAPFISHDGLDEAGIRAEVKVVLGYGEIVSVTDSTGGKTKKIEFQVRNTTYNPSGWSRDKKIQDKIEKARETGELIHFRLETRRKEGQDRATPIADIGGLATAKDSIVKSLAAVKLDDDENWTISADAVTRFDEDPSRGGLHSANDMTPEQLGKSAKPQTPWTGPASGREPAPYVGRLSDGNVNPGTVAILAPLGFFNYLLEYERDEGVQIDKDRRKEIAHTLLMIANKLQADIYSKKLGAELTNGNDLTAGSHTRARALIFETIRSFAPITDELLESDELYKAWQKKIYVTAYAMWDWAIDEVDGYLA
jgi:hypothetical protein